MNLITSVELPMSIIVGCLPTLRPIFDKRSRIGGSRVTPASYDRECIQKTTTIDVNSSTGFSQYGGSKHGSEPWDSEALEK